MVPGRNKKSNGAWEHMSEKASPILDNAPVIFELSHQFLFQNLGDFAKYAVKGGLPQ
jgi:hypothetical protein